MGIFGDIGGFIMAPLYYVISVILVGFHKLFEHRPRSRAAAPPGCCRSSG